MASTGGRLVADARWGIALVGSTGVVHEVIWPYGYSARDDGRVVLLDQAGQIVAGEGDQVRIGGGEAGTNGAWVACGNGIEVVRGDQNAREFR